jgi:chloride channel 7
MLLPVLVAILVAKAFADTMEPHSYYHAVMEANHMPFLASKPHTRVDMDLLTVKAVMTSPVQTIPRLARVADLECLLRDTSHNGFPVVQPGTDGLVCVGLVTRHVLLVCI